MNMTSASSPLLGMMVPWTFGTGGMKSCSTRGLRYKMILNNMNITENKYELPIFYWIQSGQLMVLMGWVCDDTSFPEWMKHLRSAVKLAGMDPGISRYLPSVSHKQRAHTLYRLLAVVSHFWGLFPNNNIGLAVTSSGQFFTLYIGPCHCQLLCD